MKKYLGFVGGVLACVFVPFPFGGILAAVMFVVALNS